jgi:16S rRNA (cytosine1402-N4)-methyltransferase
VGFDHSTVLLGETVQLLAPRTGRVYCDCTLGGGGATLAILEHSAPEGRVIAIDRDPAALHAARQRLAVFGQRVTFVHGCFGGVKEHLGDLGVTQVDGFVMDLGVSSPQLDHAERGFSFSKAGPLDMRMDPTTGPTALELIADLPEDDLSQILRDYGEERYHRRIARLIKDAAQAGRLHTTTELAAVVATAIPAAEQRKSKIHPATRTFQALRIAVNRELEELETFLAGFPELLRAGGRCCIISFHSLEDRLVKNCFRNLAWTSSLPEKYALAAGERTQPVCTLITRKPVDASDEEVGRNPRSRSAHLRVCERTNAPNLPSHRA